MIMISTCLSGDHDVSYEDRQCEEMAVPRSAPHAADLELPTGSHSRKRSSREMNAESELATVNLQLGHDHSDISFQFQKRPCSWLVSSRPSVVSIMWSQPIMDNETMHLTSDQGSQGGDVTSAAETAVAESALQRCHRTAELLQCGQSSRFTAEEMHTMSSIMCPPSNGMPADGTWDETDKLLARAESAIEVSMHVRLMQLGVL